MKGPCRLLEPFHARIRQLVSACNSSVSLLFSVLLHLLFPYPYGCTIFFFSTLYIFNDVFGFRRIYCALHTITSLIWMKNMQQIFGMFHFYTCSTFLHLCMSLNFEDHYFWWYSYSFIGIPFWCCCSCAK